MVGHSTAGFSAREQNSCPCHWIYLVSIRSSVVFVPAVEHWTSSTPSAGYPKVHGSLPNWSTCVLCTWRKHSTVSLMVPCGGAPGVLSWGPFIRGHPVSVQVEQEFGQPCRH
ncbi:hypothetical protein GOODEAATRI_029297 [Goodea atripinnis]|uniref:Uncharacterized protein n=1 Tax=Goodea atripinnis TaxID=208336 RepID=A0ABV0MLN6_9TELE